MSAYMNGTAMLNGTAFELGGRVLVDRCEPVDSFEPVAQPAADLRREMKIAALRCLLSISTVTHEAQRLEVSPARLSWHVSRLAERLGLDSGRANHKAACAERARRVWAERKAATV